MASHQKPTPEVPEQFIRLRQAVLAFVHGCYREAAVLVAAVHDIPPPPPLVIDDQEIKDSPSLWVVESLGHEMVSLDCVLTDILKECSVPYGVMVQRVIECHQEDRQAKVGGDA